ncbi:hypothetical protein [Mycobacterium interjectum]|uniref:hypothetical protein n=1 Tax=Mycobacterium interjectum TaxID=33895 RepID=UPI00083700D7|nr:hypothetical protein [Mycobacterium interjectum]MCV7091767.1 hypothetical protein [Mycobacterium interjectum]
MTTTGPDHQLTLTVKVINGEPMLDATAMSLLLGVDEQLIAALPRRDFANGYTPIPQEWIRNGKRRAKEAAAHTGSNDMVSSLTYWAAKDRGAELQIVYEGGLPA